MKALALICFLTVSKIVFAMGSKPTRQNEKIENFHKINKLSCSDSSSSDEAEDKIDEYMDGIWKDVDSENEGNKKDDKEEYSDIYNLFHPNEEEANTNTTTEVTGNIVDEGQNTSEHVATDEESAEDYDMEGILLTVPSDDENTKSSYEQSDLHEPPISTSSSSLVIEPNSSVPLSVTNPSIIIEEDVEEETGSSTANIDIVTNNNTGIIGGTGFNTTYNTFNDDITESTQDEFEHEEETNGENAEALNNNTSGDETEIYNSNCNINGLREEVDSIKPPFIEQEAENTKSEAPKEEIDKIGAPKDEKVKPEASKPETIKTSTLSSEIKNDSNDETVIVVEVSNSWSAFSMSLLIVAVLVVVVGVLVVGYIRFIKNKVESLEEL